MQCPTAVRTTESNSESVEVCWTPRGKNNSGSPNTAEDRSTGGLALPAVTPAQSVTLTRILTVPRVGETANLKSPTLRIPSRSRGGGCQAYPLTVTEVLVTPLFVSLVSAASFAIGGLVFAAVYNATAQRFGGVEVRLSK